jgi:hypothetical protein
MLPLRAQLYTVCVMTHEALEDGTYCIWKKELENDCTNVHLETGVHGVHRSAMFLLDERSRLILCSKMLLGNT